MKTEINIIASPLIADLKNCIVDGFDQVEFRVCPPGRRFVNRCNFISQEVRGYFPGLFLQLPAFHFSTDQVAFGDSSYLTTYLKIIFIFHYVADFHDSLSLISE